MMRGRCNTPNDTMSSSTGDASRPRNGHRPRTRSGSTGTWRGGVGDRPLVGVRVLELAVGIAGPYGGKLLSDLGADVVKVEPPGGDPARQRGPFRDGTPDPEASGFYLYLNAGKRGVTLDLTTEAGRDALLDLVAQTDVLIESYAPGDLDQLGVGVEVLQDRNPRLTVVSVTSFGQWGPRAGWQGNDLVAF